MIEREIDASKIRIVHPLTEFGFQASDISKAITYTHNTFDALDEALLARGQARMANMIELANLSAMIGNVFRSGIESSSGGRFEANGPHKYPDLIGKGQDCCDVEIKVALEKNNPKGHLVKPGPHLTVRYVLGTASGSFNTEERGDVVWIWEVRVGRLQNEHFNFSNTKGDSGKTAVINAAGMKSLEPVYFDPKRCPYGHRSVHRKSLCAMFNSGS